MPRYQLALDPDHLYFEAADRSETHEPDSPHAELARVIGLVLEQDILTPDEAEETDTTVNVLTVVRQPRDGADVHVVLADAARTAHDALYLPAEWSSDTPATLDSILSNAMAKAYDHVEVTFDLDVDEELVVRAAKSVGLPVPTVMP